MYEWNHHSLYGPVCKHPHIWADLLFTPEEEGIRIFTASWSILSE